MYEKKRWEWQKQGLAQGASSVIERGRVKEVGSHRELLKLEGLYYRLYTHYMDHLPLGEAEAADVEVLATQEASGK